MCTLIEAFLVPLPCSNAPAYLSSSPRNTSSAFLLHTMARHIPTDLEKYEMRFHDFCMTLPYETFVNFSHFLIVAAIRHNGNDQMLQICSATHNGLLSASQKERKTKLEYHCISLSGLIKSFIDPRLNTYMEKKEERHDDIVHMVSFVEALMEHINDYSPKEHWKVHEDFMKKKQGPFVEMYEEIEDHAFDIAEEEEVETFKIADYKSFDTLDDNSQLLAMLMSVMGK